MPKMTVKDLDVKGKKVIVRVDFNVPLKNGVITDDNRIQAALPTINYLIENGAKVILLSHLGKVNHKDPEKTEQNKKDNNMAPVAQRLAEVVDTKVYFCPVTKGEELENMVAALQEGEILLVQNTRYEKGEEKNDPELGAYWASLGDLFVSDAFGSVHRAHASTVGIAQHLPSACGFLVEKEVANLSKAIENPARPMIAILGGAKVSDKIKVIENFLNIADKIFVGGAMAYTFFAAQGKKVGTSKVEEDKIELAKEFLDKANGKIILPLDNVCAQEFSEEVETRVFEGNIEDGWMGLDIGPKSIENFKKELEGAKTVVWNGPMGVFEMDKYSNGTKAICAAIAELPECVSVIGGGDSAAAAIKMGFREKFTHISTGGGASLEFMEGNGLPGIDAIQDKAGRKPIIVGNWKMNKTMAETKEFIEGVDEYCTDKADFGIATSFLSLETAVKNAKNLIVAAENCHFEDAGAFTGEVSVPMLEEIGLKWCIIGHSERRQMFGDTDETVNKKAKRLIAAGITPIICCGETLEQFEAGKTEEVVRTQMQGCLKDLCPKCVSNLVIAYEPIWAIGTGKNATKEIAQDTCAIIRDEIKKMFGEETAEKVRIQYGGSVKPANLADYLAQPDVDGALVGGASLKVDSFKGLIDAVK